MIDLLAMKIQISTLAVALMLAACGSDTSSPAQSFPTAPSPSGPAAAVTNWSLTQRFVSVAGPDNCWVREQRARWTGATFPDLPMVITRRGDGSIKLESEFFQVNYAGAVSGAEFYASGTLPLDGGGRPCQDGTSFRQMPGVSNLLGRFSADDQSLTVTEVNSYHLTSGELVIYRWDWQARRN